MSKMSEIDYTIRNWLKNNATYIALAIFIILIAITLHGQADRNIKRAREKENRINNIEKRLNEQMNYIHELKADTDNLYRVVE